MDAARHLPELIQYALQPVGNLLQLIVQVTDNGIGLPPDGRRSGLSNLARRAEKLRGELRLGPADPAAPSPGTRLEWRVPRS